MSSKFIAGVTAMALAATALHAQPGGGQGGGQGKGGGDNRPEQAKGGGNGKSKGGAERPDPAQGAPVPERMQASQRVQGQGRDKDNGKAKGPDARVEAPRGKDDRQTRAPHRGPDRSGVRVNPSRADRGPKNSGNHFDDAKSDKGLARGNGRENARSSGGGFHEGRSDDRDFSHEPFRWGTLKHREVVQGCPPGLEKKTNGCMPPGLAKARYDDWREDYDRPDWWGLDGYQGRYSYHDGRLLQLGGNGSILGYLPLLGGALAPGNLWPSFYEPVAVPDYYQSYYNLGSDDSYRYYDDAFYSVDPQTQAISAIAALLTGDDFAVGQPLPDGYDVYNVPYSYRDEYVDGPEAEYRYSDGYIYEVDPTTRLIQTAIELLT